MSPGAPDSPSRASPARRRPSPSLGPAGDGSGGGPETLTRTRNPPAASSQGCAAGTGRPPATFPIRGAGVATAAEHFRVRRNLRGKSALPRPAGPGVGCCPLLAAPSTSRLLSRGRNARTLGKQITCRKTKAGIRRAEIEAGLPSVPKFDKIPWFSEASLVNKPLVLSLPKRSPHASATFLVSSKKDMNLPILFQVPDVLSKVSRNQSDPVLIRNKQLCSTCREIKMIQPRTMIVPGDLKLSFKNFMSRRMMSLHPPKAQTVSKPSRGDIPTESIHYRLPILGPRTAVFHGTLSDAYKTLQETQLSYLSGKKPMDKTMRQ
ncbi:PREDICTED: uncharacterized protein C1orf105 homolog [Ceratotherium simum simum]|uniref:Uncharacterized protein C1orf105 homolog n=1 Tax=Ceratotherium simum simum TaxID=73337 RepID=A0ABM0HE92_CERSS|nr:PREDICTED: uncharacterized protein C1orf105 homolog [Ceratotherium simum simum]